MQDNQIGYTDIFCSWIDNTNDNVLSAILYALTKLIKFDVVKEKLIFIANLSGLDNTSERELRNCIAEIIACKFIEIVLGYKVTIVESNRGPVLSPFRQERNKSCDICAVSQTGEHFFEVKDSSTEVCSRKDYGDHTGYTPATKPYIEQWLYWKCEESIKKGATDLFAVVPMWVNPLTDNPKNYLDSWAHKIFTQLFQIVDRKGENQYAIRSKIVNPGFFRKIYLPNRDRYLEIDIL